MGIETQADDLQRLVERIEAATGPDRELDRDIGRAVSIQPAPAYTASLDAAMTLVPEGDTMGWEFSDGAGGPTARIWHIGIDRADDWEVGASPLATPALALCAASLRARITQENSNG